jgi:hypothetical protein
VRRHLDFGQVLAPKEIQKGGFPPEDQHQVARGRFRKVLDQEVRRKGQVGREISPKPAAVPFELDRAGHRPDGAIQEEIVIHLVNAADNFVPPEKEQRVERLAIPPGEILFSGPVEILQRIG